MIGEGAHVEASLEDALEGAHGGAGFGCEVGDSDAVGVVLLHEVDHFGEFRIRPRRAAGGFEFTGHALESDNGAGGVVEGELGGGVPADREVVVRDEFDFVDDGLAGGHHGLVVVEISVGEIGRNEFVVGVSDDIGLVAVADEVEEGFVGGDEATAAVFDEVANVVEVLEKAQPMRGGRRSRRSGDGAAAGGPSRGSCEGGLHTEPQRATASCSD